MSSHWNPTQLRLSHSDQSAWSWCHPQSKSAQTCPRWCLGRNKERESENDGSLTLGAIYFMAFQRDERRVGHVGVLVIKSFELAPFHGRHFQVAHNAIQKSLLAPGKGHGIWWTPEMKRLSSNCMSCMFRNLVLLFMVWMAGHACKNVTLMNLSRMVMKKGYERSIRSLKFQMDKWGRVFPRIILVIYIVSPDSELC